MTAHIGLKHGFAPEWLSKECPLCLLQTGAGRATISLHFSRHLEEIALVAVPRTVDSDSGSDTSSQVTLSSFHNQNAHREMEVEGDPERFSMKSYERTSVEPNSELDHSRYVVPLLATRTFSNRF